jgi:hypothetical protein
MPILWGMKRRKKGKKRRKEEEERRLQPCQAVSGARAARRCARSQDGAAEPCATFDSWK